VVPELPDARDRANLVVALGAIGDPRAIRPLESALANPRLDVVVAAANALAHFGEAACVVVPALETARGHHALKVRWAAASAVSAIRGGPIAPAPLTEPQGVGFDDLMGFAANGLVGAGSPVVTDDRSERPRALGCEALRGSVRLGPDCIVAQNAGEWGGGIGVGRAGGSQARLLVKRDDNVKALFQWHDEAIAVTGSTHGNGAVLAIRRVAEDRWIVEQLAELPGLPAGYVIGDQEIVVATWEPRPPSPFDVHMAAFAIDRAGHVRRAARTGEWRGGHHEIDGTAGPRRP
jgi:hypothetical protein